MKGDSIMEPNTTHNSSFGNHGPGSQSTNTGPGSQSVNIAGPQHFSVQKYFHISNPDLVSALDALKNADESTRQDHSKIAASDIIYWLHSLSKVNYTERQHLLRSQSTEGTGRWLLEAEEFRRWIQTLGGFLWMEGIIGAGKSTLASIIADHLNTPPAKEPTTCCIYIYLNDGDDTPDYT
ncbi:hypothetical protein GGR52DRAFT_77561 [Hypoxylon sp. FL1284]|nr:hypothetical protein GGR52DRAFT_77561 [Hypoxylon sp. FL1284]